MERFDTAKNLLYRVPTPPGGTGRAPGKSSVTAAAGAS